MERLGNIALLKEQTWQLASKSLEENDIEAYDLLVEFHKNVALLLKRRTPAAGESQHPDQESVDVFSRDGKHSGLFDRSRWHGRGSKCVQVQGVWKSLSRAGADITGYQVRGPEWWRYKDDMGRMKPVSELLPQSEIGQ